MKTEYLILILIAIHFVADFIFQDEKWALAKWCNNYELSKHVLVYTGIFIALLLPINLYAHGVYDFIFERTFLFGVITLLLHFITDYITSKIVHDRFEKKHYGSAIPNFGGFTMIGLDQLFHYAQLILTYKLLFL